MDRDNLLKSMDKCFLEWAYGDIERASSGEAKLGAFILGACFIDAMAGLLEGIDRDTCKHQSGIRFKTFVGKYMDAYDKEKLWEDLRCGLVHSYSEGGTYVFTDAHPNLHQSVLKDGRIILNLENFCEDLKKAYYLLRDDVLNNSEIFSRVLYRIQKMGLMGLVSVYTTKNKLDIKSLS